MSIQNLYLKQISCLQSPVNNQGWNEIVHYYPGLLGLLAKEEIQSKDGIITPHEGGLHVEQAKWQEPPDEPIPWCTARADQKDHGRNEIIQLKRFVYDCSYVSPFVRNLYSREQSPKGWYRWVGPDPVLEVKLPLAPAPTAHWLFTVTFHAFLEEAHAKSMTFEVNGKRKPLVWLEASTYQSRIIEAELNQHSYSDEIAVTSLCIAVPEARQASEHDQRILAFAIRELTLVPS